jgi:uncharacterized protein YjbI with pentapeptide repeats
MEWFINNHEAYRSLGLILAAVIGLPLAIWRSFIAQQQARSAEEQARIAAENHLAETYTKAIDQIGNEKEAIQLGGLYALEKIVYSNSEYHSQIMEVLCAFVRLHASLSIKNGNEGESVEEKNFQLPKEIIQTALTIIGRRNKNFWDISFGGKPIFEIDLKSLDLRKVNLKGANLSGSNFEGANLGGANLTDVNLRYANLIEANLEDADIKGGDFNEAIIDIKQIQPAKIYRSTKLPRKIDEKRLTFED